MQFIHKIKKILSGFIAVVFFCIFSVSAFAEDGHKIGNFQTDTTQIYSSGSENGSESTEVTKLTELPSGAFYSPDTDLFYFNVESSSFGINVPNGAIITETVTAEVPSELTADLYKNGVAVKDANLSCIKEPGKYVLAVSSNDSAQAVRINFTIVKNTTSYIKEYEMPADFIIVSATLNGKTATYSQTHIDMTLDGDYVVDYRSSEADKDFQLSVTIDHTAPTATLTGIADGKANGPVTVSDIDENVKVYITKNGKQIPFVETISETGTYVLTVKDDAGNETVYDFVVVSNANSSFKVLIVTGIVLVLALAGYLIYYKKYIKKYIRVS